MFLSENRKYGLFISINQSESKKCLFQHKKVNNGPTVNTGPTVKTADRTTGGKNYSPLSCVFSKKESKN